MCSQPLCTGPSLCPGCPARPYRQPPHTHIRHPPPPPHPPHPCGPRCCISSRQDDDNDPALDETTTPFYLADPPFEGTSWRTGALVSRPVADRLLGLSAKLLEAAEALVPAGAQQPGWSQAWAAGHASCGAPAVQRASALAGAAERAAWRLLQLVHAWPTASDTYRLPQAHVHVPGARRRFTTQFAPTSASLTGSAPIFFRTPLPLQATSGTGCAGCW